MAQWILYFSSRAERIGNPSREQMAATLKAQFEADVKRLKEILAEDRGSLRIVTELPMVGCVAIHGTDADCVHLKQRVEGEKLAQMIKDDIELRPA